MADLTPTAVSKSSNFVTGPGGDTTANVCSDVLDNRTEIYALLTTIRKQQYGATPPSNPNTGDIWRCSTTAGLYVANTTYRWSGVAWVAETADSISVTARNTVIQGAVNSAGATALFTGSTAALTVQLNATATPAVFTWMNGNDGDVGEKNYVGAVTENVASFWSSLPQSSTVYLYVNYDGTSTISGGFSTVAPAYQIYAPSVSATGTHWIDDNQGKVFVTNGSAWTQVYRVFVGTATTDTTKVTAVSIDGYNKIRTQLSYLDTDGTLSANSDIKIASQKAVKTYVDSYGAVPLSYLDTDGTLAANSDTKVATQKAIVSYIASKAATPAIMATATSTTTFVTPALSQKLTIIKDQKSQNTNGGTFSSGAWRTRDLNTYSINQIGLAALSSNQFVLPAGTYEIYATCPAYDVAENQAILYNVTTTATQTVGSCVYASTDGNNASSNSIIHDLVTLTASYTFEIRHQCTSSATTHGFGKACNFATEVYTTVSVRKFA